MGGVFAAAEPARRRRVRQGLARGRTADAQAERLRRLHRRGRVPDREEVHVHAEARDRRRQQRRPAGRRVPDAAARPVRRGAAGRRRDGHAALPQVHDRLGLDVRLRRPGDAGGVRDAARSTRRCTTSSRGRLSGDAGHDRRHDDRVVPAHSFKFAATLQAAQAGPAPVLIRIETKAGHGAGKPTTKIIEERADIYAFLVKALDMKSRPPRSTRVSAAMLSLFFHPWERRLADVSKDRVVRPFEWGLDWMPPGGQRRTPGDASSTRRPGVRRIRPCRLATPGSRRRPTTTTRSPGVGDGTSLRHVPHARWPRRTARTTSSSRRAFSPRAVSRPGGPRRAVLVLPQWNSDGDGHVGLCRLLARFGMSALRLSLPYHDTRMPPELSRADYIVSSNVVRTLEVCRQAVLDARRAIHVAGPGRLRPHRHSRHQPRARACRC